MIFRIVALISLYFLTFAFAEEPHLIDLIHKEANQKDISTSGHIHSANMAQKHWDDQLNIHYQALFAELQPQAAVALQKSQKSWIVWRDNETQMLSAHYLSKEGSLWRAVHAGAIANLTRDRALRLGELRRENSPLVVPLNILGKTLQLQSFARKADIEFLFQLIAPEVKPSVNTDEILQYDVILAPNQASAAFVFQFNKGVITELLMDAYTENQLPPGTALIQKLRTDVGVPTKDLNGNKVWNFGSWKVIHTEGGEGEDSTFSVRMLKVL